MSPFLVHPRGQLCVWCALPCAGRSCLHCSRVLSALLLGLHVAVPAERCCNLKMWGHKSFWNWEARLPHTTVLLPADDLATVHAPLQSLAFLQQPHAIWSVPKKHSLPSSSCFLPVLPWILWVLMGCQCSLFSTVNLSLPLTINPSVDPSEFLGYH